MQREIKLYLFAIAGMIVCLLFAVIGNGQDAFARAKAIHGNFDPAKASGNAFVVDGGNDSISTFSRIFTKATTSTT